MILLLFFWYQWKWEKRDDVRHLNVLSSILQLIVQNLKCHKRNSGKGNKIKSRKLEESKSSCWNKIFIWCWFSKINWFLNCCQANLFATLQLSDSMLEAINDCKSSILLGKKVWLQVKSICLNANFCQNVQCQTVILYSCI